MDSSHNPHSHILNRAFPRAFDFTKFEIYFIAGFEITESNLAIAETAYGAPGFLVAIENLKYNAQADNLNVYYFKDIEENTGKIYVITDPFELWKSERIVK